VLHGCGEPASRPAWFTRSSTNCADRHRRARETRILRPRPRQTSSASTPTATRSPPHHGHGLKEVELDRDAVVACMLPRTHRISRPVASLHRGDANATASGLCGYRPSRSAARQLGRRGAWREPATGPASRGLDCARDTALPPDPVALCGTQHLHIADVFRNQVVHETSRSDLGVASMPCRMPEPTGLDSRPIQHPRNSGAAHLATSLVRPVSKPYAAARGRPRRSMTSPSRAGVARGAVPLRRGGPDSGRIRRTRGA
jgi:hypothetical protein